MFKLLIMNIITLFSGRVINTSYPIRFTTMEGYEGIYCIIIDNALSLGEAAVISVTVHAIKKIEDSCFETVLI